jgi:hypothetical protein
MVTLKPMIRVLKKDLPKIDFLSATSAETWDDQAPPSLGQESLRSG